jgi:hypothetical protein
MKAGSVVCTIEGRRARLLTAERSALNFLQLMSGVATATRKYVDVVAGTKAAILDTRKTLPGLRQAQKYAVRVGGGAEPAHGAVRRHPDQGKPHRGGRRRGQGAGCGAGARRACRSRSK